MTMTGSCYYCGKPATSVEHVPPKCLFPAQKDVAGGDYRTNLITVPSCTEHNLGKSKDDEFLMLCLTAVVGNNGLAFLQTQTKIRRALERTDARLLHAAMPKRREATLVTPDGSRFPILVGTANLPRLYCALEHVARGLHYHALGSCFVGRCHILPDFIRFPEDPDLSVIQEITRRMVRQEEHAWIAVGANPDVFQYCLVGPDQFGLRLMVLKFFKGTRVFVSFQPEGTTLPFRTLDEATPDNPIRIDVSFGPEG